jgi:hypothetical protein
LAIALSALERSPLPFGRLARLRSVAVGLQHLFFEELYQLFFVHIGNGFSQLFFEVLNVPHFWLSFLQRFYFLGGLRWLLACGSKTGGVPREVKGFIPLTEQGCLYNEKRRADSGFSGGEIKQKDRSVRLLPFCLKKIKFRLKTSLLCNGGLTLELMITEGNKQKGRAIMTLP